MCINRRMRSVRALAVSVSGRRRPLKRGDARKTAAPDGVAVLLCGLLDDRCSSRFEAVAWAPRCRARSSLQHSFAARSRANWDDRTRRRKRRHMSLRVRVQCATRSANVQNEPRATRANESGAAPCIAHRRSAQKRYNSAELRFSRTASVIFCAIKTSRSERFCFADCRSASVYRADLSQR